LLILTHLHHDHIMDAAAAVVAFECAVWSHSDPCDELTLKSILESMTGMSWEIGEFSVSRHLRGGEILELDGRSFEVLHIPGHSPDSLCFYDEAAKLVIGGDVLFQNSIGRTDFPNGDHEELISGIKEKLWPLPDETVVHPGHGPETNIGFEKATNPFLR
jgi:glyoxylase-like metal-dependent hydrolase (beta-lactamase superfamily II)